MNDWPQGLTLRPIDRWPGVMTKTRTVSPFSAPLRSTLKDLHKELSLVKARNPVMQIALEETQFRLDGYPRATATPEHPGVILAIETPDGAFKFPCDRFITWQENLRAIVLTMERLRAVGRYGVVKHGEQYVGWKALEAPTSPGNGFASRLEAIEILCFAANVVDWDGDLPRLIRKAKRNSHPDYTNGPPDTYHRVVEAEEYLRDTE